MSLRAEFPPVNRTKGDPRRLGRLTAPGIHPLGAEGGKGESERNVEKIAAFVREAVAAGERSKDTLSDDLIGGRDDR